jgi:ubiquinone/menaquinone biosynthesis C-methylase UbiE
MFHPQGPTFWELVVQGLSSTERGYDLLAPKFDYTPFRTPAPVLQALGRVLQDLGPFQAGLDVCCGTGAGLELLRPLCTERVVGLDISRGMLTVARQRMARAPGASEVTLVRGDALEMPFREEFDVALCLGAFGHILPRDEVRLVDSVARALRPGGRFVFVTADPPPIWSPLALLARLFNLVMRIRNLMIRPPFVMYYLTFLLPRARKLLLERGFEVEALWGLFPRPFSRGCVVLARLPEARNPAGNT